MKACVHSVIVCAVFVMASAVLAAPVDLSTWTAESYSSVSGFPDGLWEVAPGGGTVEQTRNGQPTMFYSDFSVINSEVSGRISVSGGDDDFIGFVFGFQPGDSSSAAADYLLVDWKGASQSYNFGGGSVSPGGLAPAGLAVSRVTGVPDADEFWQHANLDGTDSDTGLEELARGATLSDTGWARGREYEFDFLYTNSQFQLAVDGVPQIDINGSFGDGRLGFYNFSQANVTYASFTFDELPQQVPDDLPQNDSATVVPAPGALLLGSLGAGVVGWLRRRRSL